LNFRQFDAYFFHHFSPQGVFKLFSAFHEAAR
jgi:hypothetical protein